jgi:hypothetical protein
MVRVQSDRDHGQRSARLLILQHEETRAGWQIQGQELPGSGVVSENSEAQTTHQDNVAWWQSMELVLPRDWREVWGVLESPQAEPV